MHPLRKDTNAVKIQVLQIDLLLIWASNLVFLGKFVWQVVFGYKLSFLLMISGDLSLQVNSFGNQFFIDWCLQFVIDVFLYTRASKNYFFVFHYLKSNFIVLCFWFSSLINFNSSSSVPVHIINRSSMNRENLITFFCMYCYIYFDSNLDIRILA